ncbi:MAG: hypothetical protein WD100_02950 [Tistlia sp.]
MAGKLPQSDARGARGGSGAGGAGWQAEAEEDAALASYAIDRPRAWFLLATHCLLPAFILWRMLQGEGVAREDLVALLAVFGFAGWSVVRELRAPGPSLVLERDGFRDLRRGPDLVPWEQVMEASMKRGILSRGVKIVLADGSRADIDTSLLRIRPRKLTGEIVEALRRWQATHEAAEEAEET